MTWFSIAILSAACTSLVSITDKIVVERYLRNGWSFPFLTGAFLGLYAIILLTVRGHLGLVRPSSASTLIIALLPGFLQFASSFFYVRGLLRTDAATVAAINQTAPLFSVLWGWLFFGDVFGPLGYVGIFMVILCCMTLSAERSATANFGRLNSAFFLIGTGAVLRSLGDLCIKLTLSSQDYWTTFALSRAVLLPISMLLLLHPGYRRFLIQSLRANNLLLVPCIGVLELLVIVSMLLSTAAYARGPLALVSTVVYTSPLFVLIFTVILNKFYPLFVPEHPGRKRFVHRFALTAGILLGIVLMNA